VNTVLVGFLIHRLLKYMFNVCEEQNFVRIENYSSGVPRELEVVFRYNNEQVSMNILRVELFLLTSDTIMQE
jgi:hypothetical protein